MSVGKLRQCELHTTHTQHATRNTQTLHSHSPTHTLTLTNTLTNNTPHAHPQLREMQMQENAHRQQLSQQKLPQQKLPQQQCICKEGSVKRPETRQECAQRVSGFIHTYLHTTKHIHTHKSITVQTYPHIYTPHSMSARCGRNIRIFCTYEHTRITRTHTQLGELAATTEKIYVNWTAWASDKDMSNPRQQSFIKIYETYVCL